VHSFFQGILSLDLVKEGKRTLAGAEPGTVDHALAVLFGSDMKESSR